MLRATSPACLLLALMLAMLWPSPAAAEVHRCTAPDGSMVYTDRKCEDIDALPSPTQGQAAGAPRAGYRGGCSRRLGQLVQGLRGAINTQDANLLATLYDWSGLSTRKGYAIMERLGDIATRPLVDIQPVYPQPPAILAADGSVLDANADGYFPQTTLKRAPVGLRLEQTFSNGTTPSRTVFSLRKQAGCWWVTL